MAVEVIKVKIEKVPDIEVMLDQFDKADDACHDAYELAKDDIEFVTVPGAQYDDNLRQRRGRQPCYEFPKLGPHCRQVKNGVRLNLPAIKIRPASDGDRDVAAVLDGIARDICSHSDAQEAHAVALDQAVDGGFGVWEIGTQYVNDDSFDQEIVIRANYNFASVKFDPAAIRRDKADARYAFVETWMPKSEFEHKYPTADSGKNFDGSTPPPNWHDESSVRVCRYWYKMKEDVELWALADGTTVEASKAEEGVVPVNTRKATKTRVFSVMTNGERYLGEPQEFPSKYIPLVPVYGNIVNVDGKDHVFGMVRHNKDLQRLHNVHKSAAISAVSKSSKFPWLIGKSALKGFERMWNSLSSEDRYYVVWNDDGNAQPPQQPSAPQVPVELLQLAAADNDDIKASTGQYDASMGRQSNEVSAVAIHARAAQGDVATYNYIDNLKNAMKLEGEILVDMIPRVYDTERRVRVENEDGSDEWKELYQRTEGDDGVEKTINDLTQGHYHATVTVGPSFATRRMEASASLTNLIGQVGPADPAIAKLFAYGIAKASDAADMDEVVQSYRRVLVKEGLLPPTDEEKEAAAKAQKAQQQQGPSPIDQAKMAMLMAEVKLKVAEAAEREAKAQKASADAATAIPAARANAMHEMANAQEAAARAAMVEPQAHASIEENLASAIQKYVQATGKTDLPGDKTF